MRHHFRNPNLAALADIARRYGLQMFADTPNQPWVEKPNTVLAGPATGTDARVASFRPLAAGDLGIIAGTKFTLNTAAGPLVAGAGDLTGALFVAAQYSGINGSTLTTRTAALMATDTTTFAVGGTYIVRILNSGSGSLTLTAGAGVTITGKTVIVQQTYVDYLVTFVSATATTFQSIGTGTQP